MIVVPIIFAVRLDGNGRSSQVGVAVARALGGHFEGDAVLAYDR